MSRVSYVGYDAQLEEQQRSAINSIVANELKRFKRVSFQETKSASKAIVKVGTPLGHVSSYEGKMVDIDGVRTIIISMKLDTTGFKEGHSYKVVKDLPFIGSPLSGSGCIEGYSNTTLNGVFDYDTNSSNPSIVFNCTSSDSNNYSCCIAFVEGNEEELNGDKSINDS